MLERLVTISIIVITIAITMIGAYIEDVREKCNQRIDKIEADYKILLENYNENEYMYKKMEEMSNG